MKLPFVGLLLSACGGSSIQAVAQKQQQQQKQSRMPFIRKQDLPVRDPNAWMSIDKNVEFIPADPNGVINPPPRLLRNLDEDYYAEADEVDKAAAKAEAEQEKVKNGVYRVQPFAEGMSEYDEYQQAWRLLGFMIDCNSNDAQYSDCEYGEDGGGNSNDDAITGEGCHRFVLWAAYVDLEYEGGGIGEYQYYDRKEKKWDDSSCQYGGDGDGSSRCAKMDCHLEDTHFSLLGFFKHRVIDDWMEQLFKHEGMCIWTEEEYAFMKNAREGWPAGCAVSSTTYTDEDGETNYIYYDLKPIKGGMISIGLYTDPECVVDYNGDDASITPDNVLGNIFADAGSGDGSNDNYDDYDFSDFTLSQALDYWDSAFDIFTICQPCVAHDLNNYDGTAYMNYDDDGGNYNGDAGDPFDCYDDADYTNVNQCMKFMAKTTMQTATFRDLQLARTQGTVVKSPLAGYKQDRKPFYRKQTLNTLRRYIFFGVSLYVFVNAIRYFFRVKRQVNYQPKLGFVKQPLVDDEQQIS